LATAVNTSKPPTPRSEEVQSDLLLLRSRGVPVPAVVVAQADRLGGLVYGLLRAEDSSR
jgi:hypothetical protein